MCTQQGHSACTQSKLQKHLQKGDIAPSAVKHRLPSSLLALVLKPKLPGTTSVPGCMSEGVQGGQSAVSSLVFTCKCVCVLSCSAEKVAWLEPVEAQEYLWAVPKGHSSTGSAPRWTLSSLRSPLCAAEQLSQTFPKQQGGSLANQAQE